MYEDDWGGESKMDEYFPTFIATQTVKPLSFSEIKPCQRLYVCKSFTDFKMNKMNNHFWPIIFMLGLLAVPVQEKKGGSATINRKSLVEGRHPLQIYPQASRTPTVTGFGDFKGVIEKLDYIESLGINMVWMNPFSSRHWWTMATMS
ncbi:MAG: alpha-amylase family glycosyl hydrolase [Saprospiraceae bacterium]